MFPTFSTSIFFTNFFDCAQDFIKSELIFDFRLTDSNEAK